MPMKYSIPLLSLSTILHWTLSQSVFVTFVEGFWYDGTMNPDGRRPVVGFSVWAIITSKKDP